MPDAPIGQSLFEWLSGIAMFVASSALGFVVHRLGQEAQDRTASIDKLAEQHRLAALEIWRAIEAQRDMFQAHRGDMLQNSVTKADLAAMEQRVAAKMDRMETRLTVLADRGSLRADGDN